MKKRHFKKWMKKKFGKATFGPWQPIGSKNSKFRASKRVLKALARKNLAEAYWSFAPPFIRNDTTYKIYTEGEVAYQWRFDAEKAWDNSELLYP